MTADTLFGAANFVALMSWIALGVAILFRHDRWRDRISFWMPLGLAALYSVLIVFFFAQAEGGFGSLADVQKLFTSPWAALAGWVHYLSFDLLVGSWIARQVMEQGLPRWPLLVLLPLTFLFGPAGFLALHAFRLALSNSKR